MEDVEAAPSRSPWGDAGPSLAQQGAHDCVPMSSRDVERILALPAALHGFCGSLSCIQQMICVDAGALGAALWLVAYGNL